MLADKKHRALLKEMRRIFLTPDDTD